MPVTTAPPVCRGCDKPAGGEINEPLDSYVASAQLMNITPGMYHPSCAEAQRPSSTPTAADYEVASVVERRKHENVEALVQCIEHYIVSFRRGLLTCEEFSQYLGQHYEAVHQIAHES
jgi:hypothetical protein